MVSRTASICEAYRHSEQKRAPKFCTSKRAKNTKTHPEKPKKGKTGCVLGAGGDGSRCGQMQTDVKTHCLNQREHQNHATHAKRKPAKTQCFRRFLAGQKDLNPRHAVLEWMWESAPGSKRTMLLTDFSRQAQKSWCWFGAEKVADGILRNRNDIFTKHL